MKLLILAGTSAFVIVLLSTSACTSPRIPQIPSGPNGSEIPLRVRLQLGELTGQAEAVARSYSRWNPTDGRQLDIGASFAETLRKGMPRIFAEVSEGDNPLALSDDDYDLRLTPKYKLLSSNPYGWTRSLSLVMTLEVVDRFGQSGFVETGLIEGSGRGIWRSWRFYATLPIAPLALGFWEADQWSQALADAGGKILRKLDAELRLAPIVLEAVKKRTGESPDNAMSDGRQLGVREHSTSYATLGWR